MKRIGIDLDKTMFTFKSVLYDFLNKFQFVRSDKKMKYKEIDINKVKHVNPIIKNLHKIFNPACYKVFPDAVETINKFHKSGYEIYFISNRPNISPIVRATCDWIKANNLPCDKLILGCNNKGEYALQNGIDIMIDDFEKNCKAIKEKGVKAILFKGNLKNTYNDYLKLLSIRPNFTILSSWRAIGRYVDLYFMNTEQSSKHDKFKNKIDDIELKNEEEEELSVNL